MSGLGRHEEAIASYRQALEITPDYAAALRNLGNALVSLGEHEEAVASHRKALEIAPDFIEALNDLGRLYERTNRLEDAEACIQKALRLAPDNLGVNCARAILLRRRGKIKEAIQALEPLTSRDVPDSVLSEIHSELGKLYDREHDSAKAFRHFTFAKGLQAVSEEAAPFRKEAFLAEVQQSAGILASNESMSQELPARSGARRDPAFLVGFPRSGTTLLDQILGSHPGIQVMDEKPVLHGIKLKIAEDFDGFPDAFARLDDADI